MHNRNYTIDCIRFFAAAAVVFFHVNQPISHIDNWYRNTVKYGWIGVPIFFIVSGYCIMASAFHSANSLQFLLKRIFRIFPAYWLSLFIVLLAAIFEKLYTGYNSVPNLPLTFSAWLAMLTLTTSPLSHIKTANWVYWTLTYELCFYAVISLLVLFRRSVAMVLLIAITAVSVFPGNAKYVFFLDNWMTFCLGGCIFLYFRYQGKHKWPYLALLTALNIYSFISHQLLYQPIYISAVFLTIAVLVGSHYYRSHANLFSRLGEYSYSIYLIHVPIGIFILGDFKNSFIQQHIAANILYDLFTLTVVCVLSWQMFRWVEMPGQKIAHQISCKLFRRSPEARNVV